MDKNMSFNEANEQLWDAIENHYGAFANEYDLHDELLEELFSHN